MITKIQDTDIPFLDNGENSKTQNTFFENKKYLLKCSQRDLYKEGDLINQIYYLIQGKVILYKKNHFGKTHKLPQIKDGTFLGLSALFDSSEITHSATVISTSLLLVIPTYQFKDLINRWPILKRQVIFQLIDQLDQTEINIFKTKFFS
jgi:CRP-like cAMP-binding protein